MHHRQQVPGPQVPDALRGDGPRAKPATLPQEHGRGPSAGTHIHLRGNGGRYAHDAGHRGGTWRLLQVSRSPLGEGRQATLPDRSGDGEGPSGSAELDSQGGFRIAGFLLVRVSPLSLGSSELRRIFLPRRWMNMAQTVSGTTAIASIEMSNPRGSSILAGAERAGGGSGIRAE